MERCGGSLSHGFPEHAQERLLVLRKTRLDRPPRGRAVLVLDTHVGMDGSVQIPLVLIGDLDTRLLEDILEMPEVTRQMFSPNPEYGLHGLCFSGASPMSLTSGFLIENRQRSNHEQTRPQERAEAVLLGEKEARDHRRPPGEVPHHRREGGAVISLVKVQARVVTA